MKREKTELLLSEQQATFAPLTTEAQKSIILGIMLDTFQTEMDALAYVFCAA